MSEWREILDQLRADNLLREPMQIDGPQGPRIRVGGVERLCFCSNNYLGLADHPALCEAAKAAIDRYGVGSGASRLISGTMEPHAALEAAIARFKRTDAALVFPTGYMANVGAISVLVERGDTVFCDRLNHASIFDGVRLSGATLRVYPHKDADALDRLLNRAGAGRKLVVTDTVFSMDGDIAPLPELVDVCERHGATLMIDEAHATGVLGPTGRGAAEHLGIEPGRIPIVTGTLSKAVGSVGGFIAGGRDLVSLLANRARSFIYTTALPPAVCAASMAGLRLIDEEPERRAAVWERARRLRTGLLELGFGVGESETPVTPLIVGESDDALRLARQLFERNILAPAIRPPTVPDGTARLRLTPMATHTEADVAELLAAVAAAAKRCC